MKYICTILLVLSAIQFGNSLPVQQPIMVVKEEVCIEDLAPEVRLYNKLKTLNYSDDMAKLIIAQAKHETGNFKSRLYRRHANAFGVMHSKYRLTTSLGPLARAEGRGGYASYTSIEDSLIDVLLLLKGKGCTFDFHTATEYAKWLKSIRYYEADQKLYANALRAHLKRLEL